MSLPSEESRHLAASLSRRIGPDADIARVAEAIVAMLQEMHAALTPIIGQQGVAALYRRSLHLCVRTHPDLAGICGCAQAADGFPALMSALTEQSQTDALLFGDVLLTTFYTLLTTLIGPALTARLLHELCEPSLSDAPSQDIFS